MSTPDRGPAYYPSAPFHICRVTAGLSCTIVSGILIYFCMQLRADGFKLPWTFLIVLAAAIFNLIALITTVLIACCGSRSPLINLLINLPIFLLWGIAFSILCYNIYGMLAHSCSISVWAASEGVTICNIYKTLFTFVIFASLSQLALVVLDVKARRQQVREGKYDKMDTTADVKTTSPLTTTGGQSPALPDQRDDIPGWRPGTSANDKNGVISEQYELQPQYHQRHDLSPHQYEHPQHAQSPFQSPQHTTFNHGTPEYVASPYVPSSQYQAHEYSDVHERARMNQYHYSHSPQSPAYDARGYGYHDGRGY